MNITLMRSIIFLLLSFIAHAESNELNYFQDYELEVKETKIREFDNYTKTYYRGHFALKEGRPAPHKNFQDVSFILYARKEAVEGVSSQLTIVFPNLSPVKSIDQKISQGLVKRGSNVLLLQTGITWVSYAKALSDFNHIIRHQLLAAHLSLDFCLKKLPGPQERIQVMGVSLGAVLSAAMLSIDERVSAGICYMGGAGYKGSHELGIVAEVTRFFQGRSKEPSPGIVFDPKDLEEGLHGKRAKVYMTHRDLFVPPERQEDLKDVLDHPEVQWLRRGHVINAFASPKHVDEFFEFYNQAEAL